MRDDSDNSNNNNDNSKMKITILLVIAIISKRSVDLQWVSVIFSSYLFLSNVKPVYSDHHLGRQPVIFSFVMLSEGILKCGLFTVDFLGSGDLFLGRVQFLSEYNKLQKRDLIPGLIVLKYCAFFTDKMPAEKCYKMFFAVSSTICPASWTCNIASLLNHVCPAEMTFQGEKMQSSDTNTHTF